MNRAGRSMRRQSSSAGIQLPKISWPPSTRTAVCLVVLIVIGGLWWWKPWQSVDVTEAGEPTIRPLEIEQAWQKISLEYEQMRIGIELWDVESGVRASINALDYFEAASVTKVISAIYAMSVIDAGERKLSDRLADGVTTQWHLEQMIRYSNNDSWRKVRDSFGRDGEQQFAKDRGWLSFDVGSNSISTADMADVYMQLAKGNLLGQENADILLSYMTDTYEERFLPRAAPQEAVVYHKTGTLNALIHDGGIVNYGGRKYVLMIMSESYGASSYDVRMNLYDDLVEAAFSRIEGR